MVKENSRGGTEELREGCNVKEMEEEEVVAGSVGEVGDEELVEGFRGGEGGDGRQLVSKFWIAVKSPVSKFWVAVKSSVVVSTGQLLMRRRRLQPSETSQRCV